MLYLNKGIVSNNKFQIGEPCWVQDRAYGLDYILSNEWHNFFMLKERGIGILFPKLFWPTVRKKCFRDLEERLKFQAEGWEFANFLRS